MTQPAVDDAGAPVFADLTDLTASDVTANTRDVELTSGMFVTVRGLSRYELIMASEKGREGPDIEAWNLKCGMVRPKMTLQQAQAWQKLSTAGGDIARVSNVIRDLSGLGQGADKSNR